LLKLNHNSGSFFIHQENTLNRKMSMDHVSARVFDSNIMLNVSETDELKDSKEQKLQ